MVIRTSVLTTLGPRLAWWPSGDNADATAWGKVNVFDI